MTAVRRQRSQPRDTGEEDGDSRATPQRRPRQPSDAGELDECDPNDDAEMIVA